MDVERDAIRKDVETFDGGLEWGRVTAHARKVIIVACGPSLRQIQLSRLLEDDLKDAYVIAVNRAHDWLPQMDAFFTLDPNEWFHEMAFNRMRPNVTYYVGVPEDYGQMDARMYTHRVPVARGPIYLHRVTGGGFMRSKRRLCTKTDSIHTGNSAYGALGIAFHLCRAHPELYVQKKILFLGLDGTRQKYAYGDQGPLGSLSHLPMLFQSTRKQLEDNRIAVVNASKHSSVDCFSRMGAGDALEWLSKDD